MYQIKGDDNGKLLFEYLTNNYEEVCNKVILH